MKKAEGYAGAIITAFLVLFMVIILWNIFTPAVNDVIGSIKPLIGNNSEAINIIDKLETAWRYFPLVMVFGVIVFVIVRGITSEQYTY